MRERARRLVLAVDFGARPPGVRLPKDFFVLVGAFASVTCTAAAGSSTCPAGAGWASAFAVTAFFDAWVDGAFTADTVVVFAGRPRDAVLGAAAVVRLAAAGFADGALAERAVVTAAGADAFIEVLGDALGAAAALVFGAAFAFGAAVAAAFVAAGFAVVAAALVAAGRDGALAFVALAAAGLASFGLVVFAAAFVAGARAVFAGADFTVSAFLAELAVAFFG